MGTKGWLIYGPTSFLNFSRLLPGIVGLTDWDILNRWVLLKFLLKDLRSAPAKC